MGDELTVLRTCFTLFAIFISISTLYVSDIYYPTVSVDKTIYKVFFYKLYNFFINLNSTFFNT